MAYMMYVPGLSFAKLTAADTNTKTSTSTTISSKTSFNKATSTDRNTKSVTSLSPIDSKLMTKHVVKMIADSKASVGTSAYIISKSGVDRILKRHKMSGYTEAIPNIMAELFPDSRYAAYPMVFHRAGTYWSVIRVT